MALRNKVRGNIKRGTAFFLIILVRSPHPPYGHLLPGGEGIIFYSFSAREKVPVGRMRGS
jgi:hypothetical protein